MIGADANWLRDAQERDAEDPLREFRGEYNIPKTASGATVRYFCGNSLGLQPRAAHQAVALELEKWAEFGVDGHFEGDYPWYSYHEFCRSGAAHVVGALPSEVVVMNSLTANLHLLLVSFYQPTNSRFKILLDTPTFPSDLYLIQSQLQFHGFEIKTALELISPRSGEYTIRSEDIEARIAALGESLAIVLMSGVNFATGQFYDLKRITQLGHAKGAIVGFDLAHAAGNVPLSLHDWNVDFAAWCNYKYLNSGPGAVAGCFVHERHCSDSSLYRFAGWWGNDPATRFSMPAQFIPVQSADAWQLSNPPIFALAPVRASYDLFQRATMTALRTKSLLLSEFFESLLAAASVGASIVLTPNRPEQRGCQFSVAIEKDVQKVADELHKRGIVVDVRRPNIIRVAPAPMYNTFEDVYWFVNTFEEVMHELG